jgi:dihydrofolate reductase
MRSVKAALFMSLDGVTESPEKWQFDAFDADMGAAMGEMISSVDTVLLGRATYEVWALSWPTSGNEPFASFINTTPKIVVSNTLKDVAWGDFETVSLLEGRLLDAIQTLKTQSGKDIGMTGSPTLVRALLEADLLDELTLMIHPVIAGKGKRFFTDGMELKRLELRHSHTTSTGVSMLRYEPHSA